MDSRSSHLRGHMYVQAATQKSNKYRLRVVGELAFKGASPGSGRDLTASSRAENGGFQVATQPIESGQHQRVCIQTQGSSSHECAPFVASKPGWIQDSSDCKQVCVWVDSAESGNGQLQKTATCVCGFCNGLQR
ncbi:hypothetical protein GOP47_0000923 [Adiantum capillus-veneris]|uniref:Uncharacterized protein n=1 Tax=Adiantum capillus-veneris TaxID=13818 RepID=A0A9D4VET4_ADICA|nr:hypothetical protein GOP47_0000923 [Adiantum capillus-veneris]